MRWMAFLPEHVDQGRVSFGSYGRDMLAQGAQEVSVGDGLLEWRRELGVSPLSSMNGLGKSRVVIVFAGLVSCAVRI